MVVAGEVHAFCGGGELCCEGGEGEEKRVDRGCHEEVCAFGDLGLEGGGDGGVILVVGEDGSSIFDQPASRGRFWGCDLEELVGACLGTNEVAGGF